MTYSFSHTWLVADNSFVHTTLIVNISTAHRQWIIDIHQLMIIIFILHTQSMADISTVHTLLLLLTLSWWRDSRNGSTLYLEYFAWYLHWWVQITLSNDLLFLVPQGLIKILTGIYWVWSINPAAFPFTHTPTLCRMLGCLVCSCHIPNSWLQCLLIFFRLSSNKVKSFGTFCWNREKVSSDYINQLPLLKDLVNVLRKLEITFIS